MSKYLFSRKKKDIGEYRIGVYTLKYRMPKLLAKNKFNKDGSEFIDAVEEHRKLKSEFNEKYDVPQCPEDPSDEELKAWSKEWSECLEAIPEDEQFSYEYNFSNETIDATLTFFLSIIVEVEGLEDEDGPFKWKDLDNSEQREFLETVLGVLSLTRLYHRINYSVYEVNNEVLMRRLSEIEEDSIE